MIEGRPVEFPRMPFFVRPIFRGLFLNKAVDIGALPSAKTCKNFYWPPIKHIKTSVLPVRRGLHACNYHAHETPPEADPNDLTPYVDARQAL